MDPLSPPTPTEPAFVGRGAELAAVAASCRPGARVVLLGPGGAGKTTLARRVVAEWAGPAVFLDLSPVYDGDEAVVRIAAGLGLPPDPTGGAGEALAARVAHALGARPGLLLVLDNLEQLVDSFGSALAALVEAAPGVALLVTSRVRPRLPDEVTIPVGPLSEDAALALLRRRSGRADAGDEATLRAIVDRLDRLPLAVELAGSRLRFLGAADLLAQLSARLDLLSSGDGGRHGTLRAAIEWSWELLTPRARDALTDLSVFRGPFRVDAAAAVLGVSLVQAVELVELLLDHSLLRAEPAGDEPTFAPYEAVRAWATELRAGGEARDAAVGRHRRWVLDALDAVGIALERSWSAPLAARRSRLLPEALAALDGVGDDADPTAAVERARIVSRLPLVELWSLVPVDQLLARADALVARLSGAAGARPPAPDALCRALVFRSAVRSETARREGAEHDARAALGWAVSLGERMLEVRALAQLGYLAVLSGQTRSAEADFEAAVEGARALGEGWTVASPLTSLGNVRFALGRLGEAEAAWREALGLLEDGGDPSSIGRLHVNLGNLQLARGRPALAEDHYRRATAALEAGGDRLSLARLLGNRAASRLDAGAHDEAAALGGAALALCRSLALRRSEGIVRLTLGLVHEDAGDTAVALEQVLVARRALTEARDARFLAYVQGSLGRLFAAQGDRDAAVEALSAAWEGARAAGDTRLRRLSAVSLGALGARPEIVAGEAGEPPVDPRADALLAAVLAPDPAALAPLLTAPSAEVRVVARLLAGAGFPAR